MKETEIKVMNDDETRDFCIRKDYEIFKKEKEIERLNNIINELEKWLETQRYFEYEDPFTGEYAKDEITPIVQTLDKLQELKGSDEECN